MINEKAGFILSIEVIPLANGESIPESILLLIRNGEEVFRVEMVTNMDLGWEDSTQLGGIYVREIIEYVEHLKWEQLPLMETKGAACLGMMLQG